MTSPMYVGRRKLGRGLAAICGMSLLTIVPITNMSAAAKFTCSVSTSWTDTNGDMSINPGETVIYTVQPDGGRPDYSYQWTLQGSGGNVNGDTTQQSLRLEYGSAGEKRATVTVTDTTGKNGRTCTDSATVSVNDGNTPPTANANGPYSGTAGVAISFSSAGSTDSGGTIAAYTWNFGDGGSSTEANPSYTFTTAGNYTVTLTVTDDGGETGTDSTSAAISDPPPANAPPTADANGPYASTVGQPVTFSSAGSTDSDGSIVSYVWDFGDGSIESGESPNHTYTALGSYTVTLTVTDDQGDTGTATAQANISEAVACTSPVPEHCSIPDYTGPEVCVSCHKNEARDMHGSVHYQQNGPTDFVTNIDGLAGERGFDFAETGVNTYCGTHENSPRFTCAGCHVGNGRFPKTPGQMNFPTGDITDVELTAEQQHELANIDCMMCHQEQYKRFPDPAGGFELLTIVAPNVNGHPDPSLPPIEKTGLEGIPIVDQFSLDFDFVPADPTNALLDGAPIALMNISALEAARTVHMPTRKVCLNCHAGAGGGDGTKRGDMSSALISPSVEIDYHMSSAGAELVCTDCHSAGGHRVLGRGVDLRPNDVPERLTCEDCHGARPHGDYSVIYGSRRDTHAGRVACQTCHIPTYAKGVATEVARDWENPHFSPAACNGRGGWLPNEVKLANLVPTYQWFDGTSEVYVLGEFLSHVPQIALTDNEAASIGMPSGTAAYVLGKPNGGVSSPGAKLTPMKEHLGKLARNEATDTVVPHSTFQFFRTGSFEQAVLSGLAETGGMSGDDPYEIVAVHTYQSINHGVEPHDNALACGACHSSLPGGPLRMDLKGELGYQLKGPASQVCSQCHGQKGNMSFATLHDKHVRDKRKDCSTCHTFSRPERGLSTSLNIP